MQNGRSELHSLRFHLAQRRARGVIQHADWQCLLPPEGAGMCARKPKVFTSYIKRAAALIKRASNFQAARPSGSSPAPPAPGRFAVTPRICPKPRRRSPLTGAPAPAPRGRWRHGDTGLATRCRRAAAPARRPPWARGAAAPRACSR